MFIRFVLRLEVSVKQSLKRLAVTSFVASHFMYGVVDGVETVLLCAGGQVELACGCALLAANSPHSCPVNSINYHSPGGVKKDGKSELARLPSFLAPRGQ